MKNLTRERQRSYQRKKAQVERGCGCRALWEWFRVLDLVLR